LPEPYLSTIDFWFINRAKLNEKTLMKNNGAVVFHQGLFSRTAVTKCFTNPVDCVFEKMKSSDMH
jgi:hypothetical protein